MGAYPGLGAFLPNLTGLMSSGVYAFPTIETSSRAYVTNTTPIAAFRGAGRPEATQVVERAMDVARRRAAARSRRDPAQELHPEGRVPVHDRLARALRLRRLRGRARPRAALGRLRRAARAAAARREEGGPKQLGIGISTYVEITNGIDETEFGEVEITADGGAILRTGSFSHGQGHETTFAMIAAEQLGLPLEKITVVKGDTDAVASGTGTYGSKSLQIGGSAAKAASEEVVEHAKKLTADYLEAAASDIVLDPALGAFHPAGSPTQALTWAELAARAAADGKLEELKVVHEFKGAPTFPFGAHVAVVEVDVETAQVELLRLVAVDDAGTLINPLVAEGQVHGGVATGVSQALYEHFSYDEDGNPLTSTFLGYAFPSAADLPSWEAVEMVTPTPRNPLGAKGIGESGTIGSTPAVQSAVIDALAPYGVRHVEMPVNGENVWRALQEAKA